MTSFTGTEEFLEDPPPLEAGEVVAPGYEVIAHLHRSNSFDVYDAYSEERACRCIAKTPIPDLVGDKELARDLFGEGRLLEKLTHPHIVRAYETIKNPRPTLILETLTGVTLQYMIETRQRRLPLGSVIVLGIQLCSAVHYLHYHGILHLDLKPSNIVSERGLAKILDLSIARPPGRGESGAGTPQYMAPEQVRGGLLGPAADVWGIGATLYEAATNVAPFNDDEEETGSGGPTPWEYESDTHEDLEDYEQLHSRSDPVRTHRRVPRLFAEAVEGCLYPDPSRRPTVEQLTKTLSLLAETSPG